MRISVLDINEVGTGGGSLATLDPDGRVHVGPESSGAEPGPVCYARGGEEPTVTDGNVVVGRLDPMNFLGGQMRLDLRRRKTRYRQQACATACLTIDAAALGILRIANAQMANAVRAVTTAKGFDPREFAMFAYGGAGPLHAIDVARELGVTKVIIPLMPGHFSAYGMLLTSPRRDYAYTHIMRFSVGRSPRLGEGVPQNGSEGERALQQMPVNLNDVRSIRVSGHALPGTGTYGHRAFALRPHSVGCTLDHQTGVRCRLCAAVQS